MILVNVFNINMTYFGRLTPSKRSHRNTSFAIMTELPPSSRTPSPPSLNNNSNNNNNGSSSISGRVSPFRGRGFRAGASSRHTTPSTSPPPILAPTNNNNSTFLSSDSSLNSNKVSCAYYLILPSPTHHSFFRLF